MQERQRYFENSMAKNQAQELLSKEVCLKILNILIYIFFDCTIRYLTQR
jgi:hypothetical protein